MTDKTQRLPITVRYLDPNFDRASAQAPADAKWRAEVSDRPGGVYYGYGATEAEALADLAGILSWVIGYYLRPTEKPSRKEKNQ